VSKPIVAIVRYEKPLESVRKAVDLCRGLDGLPAHARVFIKPNIVFWTRATPFPKWGVITTSRVVEDEESFFTIAETLTVTRCRPNVSLELSLLPGCSVGRS